MAGLKDKLTSGAGSPLSRANGSTPSIPVGATDQSKLQDEYSINGNPNIPMNGYFSMANSIKPSPSNLDINGVNPSSPLSDQGTIPINNSFANGTYQNSAPSEGIGNI
jgi:hypothetical protein